MTAASFASTCNRHERHDYYFCRRYADFVEEADGLSKIESLQSHENQKIYESAVKILDTYFETENDGEDADIAPAMDCGITKPTPSV